MMGMDDSYRAVESKRVMKIAAVDWGLLLLDEVHVVLLYLEMCCAAFVHMHTWLDCNTGSRG